MALRVNLLPLSQVMKANFVYYYDDVCIVYFVFYLQKKSIPMNVIIIMYLSDCIQLIGGRGYTVRP